MWPYEQVDCLAVDYLERAMAYGWDEQGEQISGGAQGGTKNG